MASNTISILIQAKDNASATIKSVGDNIEGAGNQSASSAGKFTKAQAAVGSFAGIAASAGLTLRSMTGALTDSIQSANNYQNAMAGLASIARHFQVDTNSAKNAAVALARDGLMTVTESATGLKNLLASGFSLDQAITLMNRFKDSAAFNRQASLGFGQAVASATEGIKNGNSILVDNAGVTKNLSVILTEAGYSAQDLMKATTDASVRQALFNGIVKETAPMVGNAAQLSDQFAGSQSRLSAQIDVAKQKIGTALQPVLLALFTAITPVISAIGEWIGKNPQLAAALTIGAAAFLGLAVAIGAVGLAAGAIGPLVAVVGGPVLLAILGIGAAVSAVAGLIIAYWGPISGFVSSVFAAVSNAVGQAIGWIGERVTYLKDHFWETIGFIIGFFATLPIMLPFHVYNAISSIIGFLSRVDWGSVFANIGRAFEGVWNSVKNAATNAWNFIKGIDWGAVLVGIGKGIGNSIIGMIEGAINGALSGLPGSPKVSMPRFASGTGYAQGGVALVGENGPELVNMPQGARVTQAYRTRQMLNEGGGQGGGGITINGNVILQTPEAVDKFFKQADQAQRFARMGMAA